MNRPRSVLSAIAIVLLAANAPAQELGPVMPSTPAAIETAAPPAPITVREEDADAILKRLAPKPETPPPAPPGAGTREFTADEPERPVVNQTSRFVFTDETDRPAVSVKSLSERQAAVEAVRQSAQRGGR